MNIVGIKDELIDITLELSIATNLTLKNVSKRWTRKTRWKNEAGQLSVVKF